MSNQTSNTYPYQRLSDHPSKSFRHHAAICPFPTRLSLGDILIMEQEPAGGQKYIIICVRSYQSPVSVRAWRRGRAGFPMLLGSIVEVIADYDGDDKKTRMMRGRGETASMAGGGLYMIMSIV
jgi:hypothetical protein